MIRCILGSQCACGSVFCWPLLHIPSLLFPLQPLKLHPKFSFAFSLSLSREPRWNGLGTVQHQEHGGGGSGVEMSRGGDRDAFFHCLDRVPSGLHIDADFPSDEDDDDVRLSFASAMGDQSAQSFRRYQAAVLEEEDEEEWEAKDPSMYDMWMSDDMSIQERRRHLHQGLGMASSRDLALRRHSMKKRPADIVPRSVSRRLPPPSPTPVTATSPEAPPPSATATPAAPVAAGALQPARAITRRHSDTSLAVRDGGDAGKPALALRRVRSLPARHAASDSARAEEKAQQAVTARELPASSVDKCCEEGRGDDMQGSGGKEVAAVAAAQQQSGVPGLEEIEKFNGNTPIMKHLVRRGTSQHQHATPPKGSDKSAAGKKGGWLKNIKSVAIGFIHDKDTANAKPPATSATATTTAEPKPAATTNAAAAAAAPAASSSERLKVHQSGKSSKELTGLDMCQEIQAHEGSIGSIKFSTDGRRLASARTTWCACGRSWRPAPCRASWRRTAPGHSGGGRWWRAGVGQLTTAICKKQPVNKGKSGGRDSCCCHRPWTRLRLWDTESKVCLKTFTHSDYGN